MRVSASAENKIAELEEEVAQLKEEVKGLWQVIRGWKEEREVRSDSRSISRPVERVSPSCSYTGYSPTSTSQSPERGDQIPQSVPVTGAAPVPTVARTSLTWHEREAICVDIGRFVARCISGSHRSASGRDRIPLTSRLWVIVRDYWGQIYTPVKVVRSWSSCKNLCKPGNSECGDSVFVGLPSEREARKVVHAASLLWPQAIEG